MKDKDLWKLMQSTRLKLEACYKPAIQQLVSDSELSLREWMMLITGLTFDPEDITLSHLMVRGPYTSCEQYLNWLNNATDLGYYANVSGGEFHLTSKGVNATREFIKLARDAIVSADPLPPAESMRLAKLYERLVLMCLETPPPPDTWSIRLSYKLMPEIDPPMPFIEQALSCLSAYRDDAHLAAWQSSSLSATALETLTLIWREQGSSLDEIFVKLAFRGHPKRVYINALDELENRGYISGNWQLLRLTDEGKMFRDQVEAKTDQYFYSPWSCLTSSEKQEIADLLDRFCDEV
jgi:hypothetical protein